MGNRFGEIGETGEVGKNPFPRFTQLPRFPLFGVRKEAHAIIKKLCKVLIISGGGGGKRFKNEGSLKFKV